MPTITTFAEAHSALRPYYNYSRTPYTLDAMRGLMQYLGNPQEKIRVVHVAGTSGKTSTSYYCSALLVASGKTAGLFVSPHVDEVNERLQINGAVLPEAEYCALLNEFLTLLADCPVTPSYFELLAAMAYWEFARRGLDFAVMEVGLGGLLDATNVVSRPDKVCVITDIGLDHTEILGDTIEQIAFQKAGIMQPGNQVYMHQQSTVVVDVMQHRATEQGASLHVVAPGAYAMPDWLPLFQQRNLALAVAAINATLQESNHTLTGQALMQAAHVTVPARLETFKLGNKIVIVDGSHNEQKLSTMLASLRELHGDQPLAMLCAFVQGNQQRWQGGLRVLMDQAGHIVFTTFHSEQDVPKSSVTIKDIEDFCHDQNFTAYTIEPTPAKAYQQLLQRPEKLLIITGSFYLLNHIRPLIAELHD